MTVVQKRYAGFRHSAEEGIYMYERRTYLRPTVMTV